MLEHVAGLREEQDEQHPEQDRRANLHPVHRRLPVAAKENGPAGRGRSGSLAPAGSVVAGETEQVQQADEQVEDVHVQLHRRDDVVVDPAIHHAAGVVENETAHQHHDRGRKRERHRRDGEEDVQQRRAEDDEQTDEQEAAEEAEVAPRGERVTRQAEEDHAGTAQRGRDDLRAVGERQIVVEDRAETEAHQAGDGKYHGEAGRGIGGARQGQPHQQHRAAQREQVGDRRHLHEDRRSRRQSAEQERHRQQHVGVAQQLVRGQYARLRAGVTENGRHVCLPPGIRCSGAAKAARFIGPRRAR